MTEDFEGDSLFTGPREDPRRYRVVLGPNGLESVGDGGEGLVFRALCSVNGADEVVALKLLNTLHPDAFEVAIARAAALVEVREARIMRQREVFVGTGLVRVHDLDDADFDVAYSVSDWIPGVSFVEAARKVTTEQGLHWVAEVARALNVLHRFRSPAAPNGIVHRDVKPSNIRITPSGEAILIDFGIARPHDNSDSTEGVGTFLWRAPEVIGGPGLPGPSSDDWGVGAIAYWVLTGDPPRLEAAKVARDRILNAARSRGCKRPIELADHISVLLEADAHKRPRDMAKWADQLDEILTGVVPASFRLKRAVKPAAFIMVTLAVASVVASGFWWVARRHHSQNMAAQATLSTRVANEASSLRTIDSRLSDLLSLAAYDISPTPSARADIVQALNSPLMSYSNLNTFVNTAVISPDGKTIIIGGSGDVIVKEIASGRALGSPIAIGGEQSISGLDLSTDGRYLAIATNVGSVTDLRTQVQIWNLDTHRRVSGTASVSGQFVDMSFDRQGRQLAVLSTDGLLMWTPENKSEIFSPDASQGSTGVVGFGANDSTVVTATSVGEVTIRSSTTSATLRKFKLSIESNPSGIVALAFNQGCEDVAVGDETGKIQLWSVVSGTLIDQVPGYQSPDISQNQELLSFNSNSSELAVSYDNGITDIINAKGASSIVRRTYSRQPSVETTFLRGTDTLVTVDGSGDVAQWSGSPNFELSHYFDIQSPSGILQDMAFDRNGLILALAYGSGNPVGNIPMSGAVRLVNALNGSLVSTIAFPSQSPNSLVFSPHNDLLVVGTSEGQVGFFTSGAHPTEVRRVDVVPHGHISVIALSANGSELAVGEANGQVIILNLPSDRLRSGPRLKADGGGVRSMRFNADGSMLVVGDSSGNLLIWNVVTHSTVSYVLRESVQPIEDIAVASEGGMVAAVSGSDLLLWNLAHGASTGPPIDFSSTNSAWSGIAFSPDGTLLFGEHDGHISVWDTSSRELIAQFSDGTIEKAMPAVMRIDPKGQILAIGGLASGFEIYSSTEWGGLPAAARICSQVHDNLSRSEWSQLIPGLAYRKVCPTYP